MGLPAGAEVAGYSLRPTAPLTTATCQNCRRHRKMSRLLFASFLAVLVFATDLSSASSPSSTPATNSSTSMISNETTTLSMETQPLTTTLAVSSSSPVTEITTTTMGLLTSTKRPNRRGKLAVKLAHKWMSRYPGAKRPTAAYGRCGPPPAIPNAKWNYFMSGMPLRARVQYQCFSGFLLEGDDTIMCSDDGRWSDVPACLGSGSVNVSVKIEPKSAVHVSYDGCGPMPRVENGFIKETTLVGPFSRIGDYILFDCASGFTVRGADRIECLSTRKWSSDTPTCIAGPTQRPPLPTCGKAQLLLPNAYASWASYSVHQDAFPGDRVQYTCTPGFKMMGNSTIVCQAGGEWSELPVCSALNLNCTVPDAPENGFLVGANNGTATYACQNGFNLVGTATIICQPDNTWSTLPRCRVFDAASAFPAGDEDGDYDYDHGLLNELNDALPTADAAPPVDGAKVDPALAILFEEGASSSTVTCPQPPRVLNSRQITSFGSGETPRQDDYVTYQCYYRYYLDGAATLICREDGNWSPEPPVCRAVGAPTTQMTTTDDPGCVPPPSLPNTVIVKYYDGIAHAGDVFEYNCVEGYEPSASSGRAVCTPTRRWAVDPNFSCQVSRQSPDRVPVDSNAAVVPTTPKQPATTSQPYCPGATEIDNGRMAVFYLGRARPGDIVEYKCLDGFTLDGQARMRCQEDFTWSPAPRCVAQEIAASGCSRAPTIENGYVASTSSTSNDGTFQAGDFVIFNCLMGYQLVGNKNAYCLTSGRWTTKPRCASDSSGTALVATTTVVPTTEQPQEPTTEEPTTVRATRRRPTTTTTTEAPTTTTTEPPTTRRRPTTTTTTEAPQTRSTTSVPASTTICSDLASPAYAIRELTSYWMAARPGDFVRFRCLPGYNLIGNNRVVCQNDGSWSLSPTCSQSPGAATTMAPLPTTTMRRSRPTTTTTVPATEPPTEAPTTIRTRPRPTTTATLAPVVAPAPSRFCTQPPVVANAAQMPSFQVGSQPRPDDYVDYVCGSGFSLVGMQRVTCQSNLRWSAVPFCQPIQTCSQPPPIDNGLYMPNSQQATNTFRPGDSVTVSCQSGYDLVGGSLLYCLASGDWSQAPVCMPSAVPPACTQMPTVEHAIQVTATFTLNANIGDYVQFKCQAAYLMMGNDTVVCQADGSWTPMPKCVRACSEPPAISNGRIKGASFSGRPPLPGDSVLVECNANFTLTGGVNYMLCRSDNSWTTAPTCEASPRGLMCSVPTAVPNADIVQKSFNDGNQPRKGDFIVFQCRAGFTTEDSVTIVCGDNGAWSRVPNCLRETTCPSLNDIPNGQLIDKTWQSRPKKGDTATYRCMDGAELRGNPLVVCKVDGTWSTMPTCEKVVLCDMPPSVEHASITYRTFNAQPRRGDAVTFDCSAGYEVIGFRTAYCKDDGTWSALPVCQKIGCGPVSPAPLNAIIANRSFTETESKFGDYVMYACNPGFRALTNPIVTCQSNGIWTQLPDCQPISCGTVPLLPANSRVVFKSFDTNARINEFFDLSCDSGYVLEGRAVVQCMANGEWTEMPRCRTGHTKGARKGAQFKQASPTISCPVPSPIPRATASVVTQDQSSVNKLVSTQLFAVGDRVRFICDRGFQLRGPAMIECENTGEWSEMPSCQETNCPPPPLIENAVMEKIADTMKNYSDGDEIKYSCQIGYRFRKDSPTSIFCETTKTWSAWPACEPIDCGRPPALENAQVRFSASTPGGIATYTCRNGFTLHDRKSAQLTCSQNGTWTPAEPPKCKVIQCEDQPVSADFATVNFTSRTVGSFATYTCQTGFKMIGSEQSVCGTNGKWSDAPICLAISCRPPTAIDNGRFTTTGLAVGDTVTWMCNDEYTLIGEPKSVCTSELQWDHIPECKFIECSEIGDFPDGTIRYSQDRKVPSVVATLQCLTGFELVEGDVELICQKNGSWSGRKGRCLPNPICPLPHLPNGYVLPNQSMGFALGAVIRYFCTEDFQLNGSALATCTDSGTWTQVPSCVACPPIVSIQNGQIIGNGLQPLVGTSIDVICDPGYRPDQPHTTLTCVAAGHWSYPLPKCVPVTCEKPTVSNGALTTLISVSNAGEVMGEEHTLQKRSSGDENIIHYLPGTHVRLVCQHGYRPSGANSTVCLNNGHWSTPLGTCIRSACSLPQKPTNGRMVRVTDVARALSEPIKGESIRFSCDDGYRLMGAHEVRCLESGQWSDPFPQCMEIRCMDPPKVENGFAAANGAFKLGSAIVVTCDNGFTLKGNPIVTCQSNGHWDAFPSCEGVSCNAPPAIDNGRVIYDSSTVGGRAQYRCNRGFNITGPSFLTCQSSGKWAPEQFPRCVEITCNQPPLIPNGVIAMHQDPPKVGAVATYICLDGFQIEGPQMIICTESGTWTSTLPSCQPVQCDLPPLVSNASADMPVDRGVGVRIIYNCVSGTTGFGDPTSVCQSNGTWSLPNFACKPSTCPEPPTVSNGDIMRLSGQSPGDYAEYRCRIGYQMSGSNIVTCLRDGSWSDSPICLAVSSNGCTPPPAIPNADVSYSSTVVGALATYSCRTGYRAIGNPIVSCTGAGSWTEAPTCREVVCYGPPSVSNAEILRLTGYSYGSSATYRCKQRYQMLGDPTVVCGQNGVWSSMPSCVAADCVEPPQITNGVVEVQGFIVGSQAIYRCFPGFSISGPEDAITCQSSGRWSLPVPECRPDLTPAKKL